VSLVPLFLLKRASRLGPIVFSLAKQAKFKPFHLKQQHIPLKTTGLKLSQIKKEKEYGKK